MSFGSGSMFSIVANTSGQRRHEQHEREIGLRFAIGLRERRDVVISAAPSGANGQSTANARPAVPTPKFELMPICSSGNCAQRDGERDERERERRQHVADGRASSCRAIKLARVTGSVSSGSSDLRSRSPAVVSIARCRPPVERREQQKVRQHTEHQRRAARRRRHVELVDDERPQQLRIDAVRDEPQRADLLTVGVDRAAHALDATRRRATSSGRRSASTRAARSVPKSSS